MPPQQLATTPPALSHLVIFNPTLLPSTPSPQPKQQSDDKDKDLEDDLKEAAQILFYTSRESGGVSRDKMLRQVGLVKGLMGFTDMVIKDQDAKDWWSVHAQKSRLIIYTPEADFHIYLNIELSHTPIVSETSPLAKSKTEPTATAQGISDEVVVQALSRGYQDFKLLHGSFTNLLPPSPSLSTLLEKYWTKFAFSFEAQYLTAHPSSDTLLSTLGGFPPPAPHLQEAISRALEDLDTQDEVGVIGRDGPLTPQANVPLVRYLSTLLQTSLPAAVETPKMDTRHTLGFGLRRKRSAESRKTSWASFGGAVGWVPGLGTGRTSSPSPSPRGPVHEEGKKEEVKGRARWSFSGLGLGMGGLGDVMGNALGMGKVDSADDDQAGAVTGLGGAESPGSGSSATPDLEGLRVSEAQSKADSLHVEQTTVDIPGLRAAVDGDDDADLGWEGRSVWLENDGILQKRRVSWVIRDHILLYIIHPPNSMMPYPLPSSRSILSFYSRISPIINPDRGSVELSCPSTPIITPNPAIHFASKQNAAETAGVIDALSVNSLAELRDTMQTDDSINEIFARTAASQFIVAKRSRVIDDDEKGLNELYMLVGRKDASLTDAEHAVRGFTRTHPEMA